MSCAYEEDDQWQWDPAKGRAPLWHAKLAPSDPKRGQEVKLRFLNLKGVLSAELVRSLADSSDQRVFARLITHGLLHLMWSEFHRMFLVDLWQEGIAMAVISFWTWGLYVEPQPDEYVRRALWCLVAAQGLSMCFLVLWSMGNLALFGRASLAQWMRRTWHRPLMGACTLYLAVSTCEELGPTGPSSLMLSLNGLLHWMLLLYELRAFQWTGMQLMPIMKSVQPITGMLVIMLFISLGFLHAFWALRRDDIDELSFLNVVVLLFTGQLDGTLQQEPPGILRWAGIVLSSAAIFIFLTCTINVFIAVLSECYAQEQAHMLCTFLMERAKICSDFFLRPRVGAYWLLRSENRLVRRAAWVVMVFVLGTANVVLLVASVRVGFTPWAPSALLAASVLLVQSLLRDYITAGWRERYLWICHEASIAEEALRPVAGHPLLEHGRRASSLDPGLAALSRQLAAQQQQLLQALSGRPLYGQSLHMGHVGHMGPGPALEQDPSPVAPASFAGVGTRLWPLAEPLAPSPACAGPRSPSRGESEAHVPPPPMFLYSQSGASTLRSGSTL